MPSVSLAVSASVQQSISDARSITTGSCSSFIAIFFTSIHALLTKHAQRTSKSCSWTLFRSRPFRFLLFCLVSLHQPLNDTLASVEVLSFAWSSDIVSPTSFSCLQRLWIFCICTASAWCLLWIRLQMN